MILHYHSVFYNEQEILKAILKLHIKDYQFHLDPMFYKGGFYRQILLPNFIGDINPQASWIPHMDARNLNFKDNSIPNIILDPPFVIANRKSQFKSSTTNFGYFKSVEDLIEFYNRIITEAYRILMQKGILVFKCQDFTDNKTIMTHVLVHNIATANGFYAKDLAILVNPKNKPMNNKLNQRHFRKVHTYFWIFEKKG